MPSIFTHERTHACNILTRSTHTHTHTHTHMHTHTRVQCYLTGQNVDTAEMLLRLDHHLHQLNTPTQKRPWFLHLPTDVEVAVVLQNVPSLVFVLLQEVLHIDLLLLVPGEGCV